MTDPRQSNDQETTSLIQHSEVGGTRNENLNPSFTDHIGEIAQEQLTPLTKVLLVLALALLVLSSIFIGLFAGAQHKLKLEERRREDGGGEKPLPPVPTTITNTATATEIVTLTSTRTQTTTMVPSPTSIPSVETCLSPQCIILSASVISSLDTSQDPCENFYEYSNGGWLRAHPLPAGRGNYGRFEALTQQNRQVLREILEYNYPASFESSDDTNLLQKLRDFYSSCLNEGRLDEIGAIPILRIVETLKRLYRNDNEIISKVPSNKRKSRDLTAAVAYLHSQGVSALFSFEIESDVGTDPDWMVLWFGQPKFGLPSKEYYDNGPTLKAYQKVVETFLFALDEGESSSVKKPALTVANEGSKIWPPWPWPPWGEDDEGKDKTPANKTHQIRKMANKVIGLERRLAMASLDLNASYQDPAKTYNPTPLSNFTDSLPQIHFPTYFSTFTPRAYPDKVVVTSPAYLKSLSAILEDTSPDILEAYFVIRIALSFSPYLGTRTKFWQAHRTLQETLMGTTKGAFVDRVDFCAEKVEQSLGFAVGRFFVNATFSERSREDATNVIIDIIKTFKWSLPYNGWMDEESANAAAKKADAIRIKVGFPLSPNTRDPSSIAKYYNGVKVDKVNFFENMISAIQSDRFKRWLRLGRRRDQDSWQIDPSTVNAYYNPSANEIVIPAGILQPPFFNNEWPSYLSYGAFGHIASHEMTHAFDSAGRLYNGAGKLEEWWSNSTNKGFRIKQDCLAKQFSAYTVEDGKGGKLHVNGNLTSGENVGDTGLIHAYRAWKTQRDLSFRNGREYLLPGLNHTREQLFFISFAQIWGNAMNTATAVQRVRSDIHSPNRHRVDGTVFNIPEFAAAFNCSKQSKLNPPMEKRCLLW